MNTSPAPLPPPPLLNAPVGVHILPVLAAEGAAGQLVEAHRFDLLRAHAPLLSKEPPTHGVVHHLLVHYAQGRVACGDGGERAHAGVDGRRGPNDADRRGRQRVDRRPRTPRSPRTHAPVVSATIPTMSSRRGSRRASNADSVTFKTRSSGESRTGGADQVGDGDVPAARATTRRAATHGTGGCDATRGRRRARAVLESMVAIRRGQPVTEARNARSLALSTD